MKLTKILAAALCFAAVATSCRQVIDTPTPEGKKISVSAQMYNFTRATDTAFEEGDKVGLHIVTPATTWLDNALYTYTAGKLTSEQTNLWYTEEEVVSDIFAYYPYNAAGNYSAEGYTFTVNADQSTKAGYTASDLMVAATTSAPTEAAVVLPFRHALSKVVITIDNQLDEAISNVWFSGVYGTTTVDMKSGNAVASGSKGTIKAASVNVDGAEAWALILVPQSDVTPQLIVTTESDKQYTFGISSAATFSAGKVSTAEISLTKESIATDFTPTISDWEADNELQFNQTEEGDDNTGNEDGNNDENTFVAEASGLGVVGSFAASAWATDAILYTTPTEDLLVAEGVVMEAYDAFKIRTAGSWEGTVNVGRGAINYIQPNKYFTASAENGAGDIVVEAAGTYDIYFNQKSLVVYLMSAGVAPAEATEQTVSGEEPITEEPEVTENMLFLSPNNNWKADGARFAAYFFGTGDAWVSMTDEDADGIYEVHIPVGDFTSVIFCRMNPSSTNNNWDNKWNQTADLVIPTDGTNLYTIAEGAWDKGQGTWSVK